ncbi:MAG: EAL domain-containing protein [Rhodocyclaceae bacterium]|nr:EAL domain-containing protein [Rhodocyclaceae bacterium]
MEAGQGQSRAIRTMRRGFALAAGVLVAIGVVFSWLSWQAAKKHEALYLSATAELSGKSLDSYFRHYEHALHVLARELAGSAADAERMHALLADFRQANPDLLFVNLLRPDGQTLASANDEANAKLPYYGDSPSFLHGREELLKGETLDIGRPTFGTLAQEWILPLRFAVRGPDGQLVAIIAATLPLARQQSFWQDLQLPDNTALGLIRDDGYIVSRFPTPRTMSYEEIYGTPRTGQGYDYLKAHGFPERAVAEGYNSVAKADYVFAFRRLPHYPLTMFVSTPINNIVAAWWQQMQFAFALLAALLAGSYAIYRWALQHQLAWEEEKAQSAARFEFLAQHDPLTELPNRLLVRDRLQHVLARASRTGSKAALLFLDLDHFKTINDSLGHPVGDLLLQAVAARLEECIRDTDMLSRLGGDEFVIILSDLDRPGDITVVAEKILGRLLQSFAIDGNDLTTSLSIGIAVYPDDGADFDTLLKKADTAMYQAKAAGRNTYRFYTEQMNIDADEHLRMRHWLRQGLEHGYFVLHYQPQFELGSGRLVGAEALIRLQHPEAGLVAPERFIRIAEDSGQIIPIGAWVLHEACRQAAAWQRAGLPDLVVAVNVARVQLLRGDLEQCIEAALAAAGLAPACLELELTESILVANTQNVLASVQRLTARGVKFAVDDFGAGHSNLAHLKHFAMGKLKIDQSLVRDVASDADSAAIVGAIIQMAHGLGLKTSAEGVEDAATAALLGQRQCDEAQGYHFGRPVPAEEFTQRYGQ